jgi:16S rRNA (guanine(966)-N(2))-methyltransferase RsmD
MGFEALSRGAKSAHFVDAAAESVKAIAQTAQKFDFSNYRTFRSDAIAFLKRTREQYDVIFADPPYFFGNYRTIIDIIRSRNLLNEDGVFAIEIHKKDRELPKIDESLIADSRRYGTSMLLFIKGGE